MDSKERFLCYLGTNFVKRHN